MPLRASLPTSSRPSQLQITRQDGKIYSSWKDEKGRTIGQRRHRELRSFLREHKSRGSDWLDFICPSFLCGLSISAKLNETRGLRRANHNSRSAIYCNRDKTAFLSYDRGRMCGISSSVRAYNRYNFSLFGTNFQIFERNEPYRLYEGIFIVCESSIDTNAYTRARARAYN